MNFKGEVANKNKTLANVKHIRSDQCHEKNGETCTRKKSTASYKHRRTTDSEDRERERRALKENGGYSSSEDEERPERKQPAAESGVGVRSGWVLIRVKSWSSSW